MIPLRLDFLNKNMYRKYPIQATSTYTFTNGATLPLALITSIQVTTLYSYSDVYISKVFANGDYINITIEETGSNTVLGCFGGVITSDQQVLILTPFNSFTTGTITIGSVSAVRTVNGMNLFTAANGMLEGSTVYCFTPPAVVSINNAGNTSFGFINLVGVNIDVVTTTPDIALSVIDVTQITSNNSFSGEYNNCATPIITQINTVFPNESGNIDIYGVTPVTITVGSGDVNISLGDLTLVDVCPERGLLTPPDNSSNTYYTDILTTSSPEWTTWSQFS